MKRLALLFIALLWACGSEQHAGSVSETTNGSIAGVWLDKDGKPVRGAEVELRASYAALSSRSADTVLRRALTDSSGAYAFDSLGAGTYTLLARSSDGYAAAAMVVQANDSLEQDLGRMQLKATSSLNISFDKGSLQIGDTLCLAGTGLCVIADSQAIASQNIHFSNVPKGSYVAVIVWPLDHSPARALGAEPVTVQEDTTQWPATTLAYSLPGGFGASAFAEGFPRDTVEAADFASLKAYLENDTPLVILVRDTISGTGKVHPASGKVLLGKGTHASLLGFGLVYSGVTDSWISNLYFAGGSQDAINIAEGSRRIVVEHSTFAKFGDGLIDIKGGSDSVTLAWNIFGDNDFACLVGHADTSTSDTGKLHVTLHHNWFTGTQSMNPRVRFGMVHVYNNLFTDIGDYAVASTQWAKVHMEYNVFWNVPSPSVIRHTSSEDGELAENDNLYYDSGTPQSKGLAFDANAYYPYALDPASQVENKVRLGAGAGKLPD